MRAVGGEDLVVLAPDDQRRRLAFAEERLECGIERHVGAVVVEQVELDVVVARPVEQRLVVTQLSGLMRDDVAHAVGVLELGGLRASTRTRERLAVASASRRPSRP